MKLQFSLRSIGKYTLVVAIVLGWWGNTLRCQNRAVNAIQNLGGRVSNVDVTNRQAGGLMLIGQPFYPPWLPESLRWLYPKRINYVYLADESIDDSHIDRLLAFRSLEGINLSSARISDHALQRLRTHRQLKVLQLFEVETVTPAAIAEFKLQSPDCEIWR